MGPLPKALSRVSLRSGLALTCGVLGLLAVLAAAALLVFASLLHRNALELTAATLREQVARDVELDVLMYDHLANLDAVGARVARLAATQEEGIHEHFGDARRFVGSTGVLSDLEASVDRYFAVRGDSARQHLSPEEVDARSGGALRLALRKATELRAVAGADVAHTQRAMQRIDRWVQAVAVGLSAFVVMSILAFAFASRALLVRPVRALVHSIQRFSSGDISVRADENAPRELHDVARTFNQMASAIVRQRENELTSLASVAHDLNNPIGVMGMLTEPRAVERTLGSDERLRRRFALLHRQAERIHRMVRDLLDAVRAETGELQFELGDHDLRDVATSSVELYGDFSERHELRLSVSPQQVVARCDPGRIEQALQNIITNAIKYSPEGGAVTVRVGVAEDCAVLSVSDQGIGMSPEQTARIFDAFQRFGPPGITGAGLGLSLARRIVEAHGGKVEVDSVPGTGSTFRILLPLSVAAAHQ